jgi:diaminohydroxyphosphoribosylaminopyrimidine deaminase/5-amino-6-(5-phosphoribosylamino)uracil reductase
MTTAFSAADHGFMARALHLAERGLYSTTPNPRVGCVIVSAGEIVGGRLARLCRWPACRSACLAGGWREGSRGRPLTSPSSPCSHHGRTPPCSDALLVAGVTRVVAAMQDPDPRVAGQGLARLRNAGVLAECGLLAAAAQEINLGFVARMTRSRPWLRLKLAASLDGKTALQNGVSQWLTGAAARHDGHRWRARACAILTGIGTIRHDDPQLNVRGVEGVSRRRSPALEGGGRQPTGAVA